MMPLAIEDYDLVREALIIASQSTRTPSGKVDAELLEACHAPAVDEWHDVLTSLLTGKSSEESLRYATQELCDALDEHYTRRQAAIAKAEAEIRSRG